MTVAKIFNGIKMVSEKYRVTQKSLIPANGHASVSLLRSVRSTENMYHRLIYLQLNVKVIAGLGPLWIIFLSRFFT